MLISEQIELSTKVVNLTKSTLNDYDLGYKVRELVNKYKNKDTK